MTEKARKYIDIKNGGGFYMINNINKKKHNEIVPELDKYLSIKIFKIEIGSIITWSCIIIYTVFFSGYTILKHRTYNSFAWDLGIMNQALWTKVNINKVFYYTCEKYLVKSGSYFGIHFAPILYCAIPIYRTAPRPETLLVIQSLLLGAAALPIYLLCRKITSRTTGLIVSTIYLLNPAIHGMNCYDFHVQSFIPLLTLSFLYFYKSKNWKIYMLSLILIFYVEEHLSYTMILYSLFILCDKKTEIVQIIKNFSSVSFIHFIPIITVIHSVHWSSLSDKIIKHFNENISPILIAGRHFKILGVDDPRNIPIYILCNPQKILNPLKYACHEKLKYIICLTCPNLILSITNPNTLLPTMPWIGISLLSNYSPYYQIGYQYPSYVIPFIYFSTIIGLKNVDKNHLIRNNFLTLEKILILYFCTNLFFFAVSSPVSPYTSEIYHYQAYRKPSENSHVILLREALESIPEGASILTQDNIFPHVSSQENSYVVPLPMRGKDIEWHEHLDLIMKERPDYILIDISTDFHNVSDSLLNEAYRYNYELVELIDNIYLYKSIDTDNKTYDHFAIKDSSDSKGMNS